MRCMILCALSASAFLGVSNAALAEEGQMTVRVEGVDLHSAEGAKAALARIHRASDEFCSCNDGRASLERMFATKACAREMTSKAVGLLDEPRVTALYEGRAFPAAEAQPMLARR